MFVTFALKSVFGYSNSGGNDRARFFMPAYFNILAYLCSRHVFAFHVSLPVSDIWQLLI